MKHEISNRASIIGLLIFVVCFVASVLITQAVEADRTARYNACREGGETKLTCGIKAVFGSRDYEA